MTDTPTSDSPLRMTIQSAYTFIRSVETNRSIAAITLDHLIDEQIQSIKPGKTRAILDPKGKESGKRLSRIDMLDSLQRQLESVIKSIQEAGSNKSKLKDLGIYEADVETKDSEQAGDLEQ